METHKNQTKPLKTYKTNLTQTEHKLKNCSYLCAYWCVQLSYTTQHRAVLIIFPFTSIQSPGAQQRCTDYRLIIGIGRLSTEQSKDERVNEWMLFNFKYRFHDLRPIASNFYELVWRKGINSLNVTNQRSTKIYLFIYFIYS